MDKGGSKLSKRSVKISIVVVLGIGGYFLIQLIIGDTASKSIGAITMGDTGNIIFAIFVGFVALGAIRKVFSEE